MDQKTSTLTEEQVEREIERLRKDPDVALARMEHRANYLQAHRNRQRLYQLRYLAKRGAELREKGCTRESFLKLYRQIRNGEAV